MKVLITHATDPTAAYPLAVVIINEQGERSCETLVRNLRDGRIYGNGICRGLQHANHQPTGDRYPVTPELEEGIKDDRHFNQETTRALMRAKFDHERDAQTLCDLLNAMQCVTYPEVGSWSVQHDANYYHLGCVLAAGR